MSEYTESMIIFLEIFDGTLGYSFVPRVRMVFLIGSALYGTGWRGCGAERAIGGIRTENSTRTQ